MQLVAIERKILAGMATTLIASLVIGVALYRGATEVISTPQGLQHIADQRGVPTTIGIIVITFIVQFGIIGLLFWLGRRDMLERRRLEENMRLRAGDLTAARDAAISSADVKSQFLANMSHEIRTPMNGVLGMTEILLDTSLNARQREFAETIQSSANALLRIIDDILDFSKVEAGMVRFEHVQFNLHTTVERVIDLFVQSARKKGLELAFLIEDEVPVTVTGDPFLVSARF